MIKREITIFSLVGSLSIIIDYSIYSSLIWFEIAGIEVAKSLGFFVGAFFAYFANRYWTFRNKSVSDGSIWRFVTVYATNLIINVIVNSLIINIVNCGCYKIELAFLISTAISASFNFIGMKILIFK